MGTCGSGNAVSGPEIVMVSVVCPPKGIVVFSSVALNTTSVVENDGLREPPVNSNMVVMTTVQTLYRLFTIFLYP